MNAIYQRDTSSAIAPPVSEAESARAMARHEDPNHGHDGPHNTAGPVASALNGNMPYGSQEAHDRAEREAVRREILTERDAQTWAELEAAVDARIAARRGTPAETPVAS